MAPNELKWAKNDSKLPKNGSNYQKWPYMALNDLKWAKNEFFLPDWSPPDNPIQSERAMHASSSIIECEEFILLDWSS